MGVTGVAPFGQILKYDGRELDTDETVGQAGILADDTLELEFIPEIDVDVAEQNGRLPEGFGGTGLLGDRACPQCTFINASGVASCEMCETVGPFALWLCIWWAG